jgi:hypothetical protein
MEYKYIQKEDLVVGEIYYISITFRMIIYKYLAKISKIDNNYSTSESSGYIIYPNTIFNKYTFIKESDSFCDFNGKELTIRLATEEEIRHLNYCIKEDRFVNLEDIPEKTQDILDLESLIEESKKHL